MIRIGGRYLCPQYRSLLPLAKSSPVARGLPSRRCLSQFLRDAHLIQRHNSRPGCERQLRWMTSISKSLHSQQSSSTTGEQAKTKSSSSPPPEGSSSENVPIYPEYQETAQYEYKTQETATIKEPEPLKAMAIKKQIVKVRKD